MPTTRDPEAEAELRDVSTSFAEREAVRQRRAELLVTMYDAGYQQRELAEIAGMTEDAVQKVIERGRK
jgi:DNA-directed RNA polymerase specialized sigma24 family protein